MIIIIYLVIIIRSCKMCINVYNKDMLFPIVIFKDKDSDYGVIVPGLPGCYSAGGTMEEAITNTKEAIELHLEGLVEDGLEIPEQKGMDAYKKEIEAGGIAALVEVDTSPYETAKSERVNVTFPKALLARIDKASERMGTTRSGFLQKAAKGLIGATPPDKTRRTKAVRQDRAAYKKK